jgi:hypothetical protein
LVALVNVTFVVILDGDFFVISNFVGHGLVVTLKLNTRVNKREIDGGCQGETRRTSEQTNERTNEQIENEL